MDKTLLKYCFFFLAFELAYPVLAQESDSTKKEVRLVSIASVFPKGPLFVIDSKPIDDTLSYNILNTINPNKILEITILKDAPAWALYGKKGAMGVIIITTKEYARTQYQKKFSDLSKKYKKYLKRKHNDDSVAYIVNGVPLEGKPDEKIKKLYEMPIEKITTVDFLENPFLNGNKSKEILVITTKK